MLASLLVSQWDNLEHVENFRTARKLGYRNVVPAHIAAGATQQRPARKSPLLAALANRRTTSVHPATPC